MNKQRFLTVAAAVLLSMPVCAEGVLPWPGKWMQGPCSSASAVELEGNKVVGVVKIPRKNMKYARYSADRKITPIKGDFELSATLEYTTKDNLFMGWAYIQAVDVNNKVMATAGLYDAWDRVSCRNYAGITGSKAKLPVKYQSHNGKLDLKILRQGDKFTVMINSAAIMSSAGSSADFGRIRLVFQEEARKGTHFGTFEFKDIKAQALSSDAPVAASVFDETFKDGFSSDWAAVRQMNCKGFVYDEKAEDMTIIGFKDFTVAPKTKSVQYMLRRTFPEIKGDFTVTMQLAWELPADRSFLGTADIQLVTKNGAVIANSGLSDGWIKGAARASATVGKTYLKKRMDQPDKKSETIRIERRSGIVSIYWGDAKLQEGQDNRPLWGVRFLLAQGIYRNKEGDNLSNFGRFTLKRIAVDVPQK